VRSEQLALKELRAYKVLLARMVWTGILDQWDLRVYKGFRAMPGLKAYKEFRARQALRDLKVLLEVMVSMAQMALRVLLELLALKALKATRVTLAIRALPAYRRIKLHNLMVLLELSRNGSQRW
jgi:hypothetical protein